MLQFLRWWVWFEGIHALKVWDSVATIAHKDVLNYILVGRDLVRKPAMFFYVPATTNVLCRRHLLPNQKPATAQGIPVLFNVGMTVAIRTVVSSIRMVLDTVKTLECPLYCVNVNIHASHLINTSSV